MPRSFEAEIIFARLDEVPSALVEEEEIYRLGFDLGVVPLFKLRALTDEQSVR